MSIKKIAFLTLIALEIAVLSITSHKILQLPHQLKYFPAARKYFVYALIFSLILFMVSFLVRRGIANLILMALPFVVMAVLLSGMYGEALLYKASGEGRLYSAIGENNAQVLERLLERKSYTSDQIQAAFSYTVKKGLPRMADILLDEGAQFSETGVQSDLYKTCLETSENYADLLKVFIDHGATLNRQYDGKRGECWGATLLHGAVYFESLPIVKVLVEAGVDVDIRDEKTGKTPLIYASEFNTRPEVVEYLIQQGADLNARDNEGFLPMITLIKYNHNNARIPIQQLFMDQGAIDPELDGFDSTGLTRAVRTGDLDKIEALLSREYPYIDWETGDALKFAVRNSDRDLVRRLVENGAETRWSLCFDSFDYKVDREILDYLLEKGADLQYVNTRETADFSYSSEIKEITVLKYAVFCLNEEYAAYLMEKGARMKSKEYEWIMRFLKGNREFKNDGSDLMNLIRQYHDPEGSDRV